MNDSERLNQILQHLSTELAGDYVLDYCVKKYGGQRVHYFELVVRLLLDGYVYPSPADLQFLTLTAKGKLFMKKGGYPVPLPPG